MDHKVTFNITAEVFDETGGEYDLRIEYIGEYQVELQAASGVEVFDLLRTKLCTERGVDWSHDIRITSIVWKQ